MVGIVKYQQTEIALGHSMFYSCHVRMLEETPWAPLLAGSSFLQPCLASPTWLCICAAKECTVSSKGVLRIGRERGCRSPYAAHQLPDLQWVSLVSLAEVRGEKGGEEGTGSGTITAGSVSSPPVLPFLILFCLPGLLTCLGGTAMIH